MPGLAIGIVGGDKLIYAKGFGERRKGGGELVSHAQSSRSRLQRDLLDPLGMNESSYTAAAIKAAANHANGYRYSPDESVEVRSRSSFPMTTVAPATSTPPLRTSLAGYA